MSRRLAVGVAFSVRFRSASSSLLRKNYRSLTGRLVGCVPKRERPLLGLRRPLLSSMATTERFIDCVDRSTTRPIDRPTQRQGDRNRGISAPALLPVRPFVASDRWQRLPTCLKWLCALGADLAFFVLAFFFRPGDYFGFSAIPRLAGFSVGR